MKKDIYIFATIFLLFFLYDSEKKQYEKGVIYFFYADRRFMFSLFDYSNIFEY